MASKVGFEQKNGLRIRIQAIPPQDTVIRIDYRNFNTPACFEDYRMLSKTVDGNTLQGPSPPAFNISKKTDREGETQIFSDNTSKAARYRRLSSLWLSLALAYVPLLISLFYSGIVDPPPHFSTLNCCTIPPPDCGT